MASRVLQLYSHQFYTSDFGVISQSNDSARAAVERTLLSTVLPQVDLRFLAFTSMEKVYGSHVYRSNLDAESPQKFGECSAMTPYVILHYFYTLIVFKVSFGSLS